MNKNLTAIIAVMLTGCLLIFYQLGTGNEEPIQSCQQENRGRQAGGGMQENKTGSVQFISQRTENVFGQFRAKLASSGNEGEFNANSMASSTEVGAVQGKGTGTGNMQRDRQAPNDNQQGLGRPGNNQQSDRANAGAGGKPPGGMQPGGGPGNNGQGRQGPGGRPEDNQTVSALSSDQLYLIGGSLLVLLASSVLLLRKKTKYSI
ncbi:MAG TPA: hypothetical protein VN441_11255 [Syntrophomonas sp.]|nr:hypothetical protein [Syntrophomonas sp.]